MDSFGALKCLQNACEKLRRAKFADAVLPIEQLIEFVLNHAPDIREAELTYAVARKSFVEGEPSASLNVSHATVRATSCHLWPVETATDLVLPIPGYRAALRVESMLAANSLASVLEDDSLRNYVHAIGFLFSFAPYSDIRRELAFELVFLNPDSKLSLITESPELQNAEWKELRFEGNFHLDPPEDDADSISISAWFLRNEAFGWTMLNTQYRIRTSGSNS